MIALATTLSSSQISSWMSRACAPETTKPGGGLLEALGTLQAAGRRLVVDEVRMDQLVGDVEVSLKNISLRMRLTACFFCSDAVTCAPLVLSVLDE